MRSFSLSRYRIGQLGRVTTGKTPSSEFPHLFGRVAPFLTPTDMDGRSRYVKAGRMLSNEGAEAQRQLALPANSICVVCIGATIGKVCMTDQVSFTNQQVNSVVVNRASHDPLFVYYVFQTLTDELRAKAGGAATPIINKSAFEALEVELPPLEFQGQIAGILSAYDDLIENCQRRIRILEDMARGLYREWFVHFRFPGADALPRVDSPLGPIPRRWKTQKLGDVLQLNYGKALKKETRRDGAVPVFGSSGIVGEHDESLTSGPGIIVGRKGNVGSVFWCDEPFFVIDTAYYVTAALPLRFLFYDLQTKNFINNDSAVPGLSRHQAYALDTLVPPADLLTKFCKFADDFEAQAATHRRQITNLRRTRDLLLPRLLSGQITLTSAQPDPASAHAAGMSALV